VGATIVQRGGNSADSVATLSATMSAYTAGTLLILCAIGDGTTNTITPPSGWTNGPYAAAWADVGLWWRLSSGAPTTVTVTSAAGNAIGMEVYEFAGLQNTIDKTATNATTGTGTSLPTGTTATLARQPQLCIAVFGTDSGGVGADFVSVYSGGYVKLDGRAAGSIGWFDIASLVVNSTAAAVCTATVTSTSGPAALIATFPIAPLAPQKISSQAVNRSYTY
jgi:hypothetical protein